MVKPFGRWNKKSSGVIGNMKLGLNDTEESFEYAIKINRYIEFIYKRKRYWIDMLEVDSVTKRAIWLKDKVLSTYNDADDFLSNAQIDGVPIVDVIAESKVISY